MERARTVGVLEPDTASLGAPMFRGRQRQLLTASGGRRRSGHLGGQRDYVFTLVLLIILVALVPVGDASPPDPLWISGIYDAGDLDEIVTAVAGALGIMPQRALIGKPVLIDCWPSPSAAEPLSTSAAFSQNPGRSPPS